MEWPADRVSRTPIDGLLPYARNARTHTDEQVAQIAASIREWGWTMPVLIDEDGGIIAGHGRVLAARKLSLTEVPTMVAAGWSKAQRQAYILTDNKLALNAGWDTELLRVELSDLIELGFNPALVGFDALELDELLGRTPADGRGIGNLAERFGIAPFSVLSAREGWWQERKNGWIALGIKSELGRGELAGVKLRMEGVNVVPGGAPEMPKGRKRANAVPGGGPMPLDRAKRAAPGGSLMPATDYRRSGKRGDGRGRPIDAG